MDEATLIELINERLMPTQATQEPDVEALNALWDSACYMQEYFVQEAPHKLYITTASGAQFTITVERGGPPDAYR
jgi:hypothetical protein